MTCDSKINLFIMVFRFLKMFINVNVLYVEYHCLAFQRTEIMYVDHMVDAVFGEWHGTFTIKTHYVDFKRKKRVIT
jgi:hypothetical protein